MSQQSLYLVLLICFLSTSAHRFGYSDWEQRKWRYYFSSCGGRLQSPIKINSQQAIPESMPALEMIRYHNRLPEPLKLHNNGHSVALSISKPQKEDYHKMVPYVFGAKLNNEYELEGLHFHWGRKNNQGSEHTFNDVRYPLEMHIVHRNRKYATVPEALNHIDGLTVLAFFYQLAEKGNEGLLPITRMLHKVEEYNSTVEIEDVFSLSSLLPPLEDMEHFYTYNGSLTTPPCSEAVTWIIFPNALPISAIQTNKFRGLQADDKTSILDRNFRKLKDIGERQVFVRT